MSSESEKEPAAGKRPSGTRFRTVAFVAIFVTCVIAFLAAYRYIIDTRANDWYLFHVAQHTAWVLDKIGYSASVEGDERSRFDPAEVRATLTAWARGEDAPTHDEIAVSSIAPLSAWENWSYRVVKARRAGNTGSVGPRVAFVLKPGLTRLIAAVEEELTLLPQELSLSETERVSRKSELEAELASLRAEQDGLVGKPESKKRNFGYFFNFIVVSECGAIEVMAIFFAAVLAFPARWWKRVVGIIIGLPIMYLVNIFRLTCLGIIGALTGGGKWFDFSHHYVWQSIYIIFVVVVWLAWIELLVNRGAWFESLFRNLATSRATFARIFFFCLKFAVLITVLTAVWWLLLPYYGYLLVQMSGSILRYAFGVPIESGYIHVAGPLNTESMLVFHMTGRDRSMPIALLITNVSPYVALVLATGGLKLGRRLRILAYGFSILFAGHFLYIVILFQFQHILQRFSELPTAVIQFFLTLPFLLWIIFAYWDRLMPNREDGPAENNAPPEDSGQVAP